MQNSNSPINQILSSYQTLDENYWENRRQLQCINVANITKKQTIAYTKLLKTEGVNLNQIVNFKQFQSLPIISKKNYFQRYTLTETLKKLALKNEGQVFTSTSGSTGNPTYFSRNEKVDLNYSVLAHLFLNNGPKGSTLLLDCFGMGVWIGGLITYQAFRYASLQGQPISILTPGINKHEIFHALKNLAKNFDNVIIAGYPPFIKDVIDEAKKENIDFKKFHTRLLFAAESFTENFRDHVIKETGIKNPYFDTLNIYGSAELGAMAFETPTSIFIRRLALKYPRVYDKLFLPHRVPTLAQFNPDFVSFEEHEQQILITADSVCPFVRYNIGDNGGVYKLSDFTKAFSEAGIDLVKEAKRAKVPLLYLPYVFIYERNDLSTTLYGLQIYPQSIKKALEERKFEKFLTGKFKLQTSYDKKGNQFLEIHIELQKNIRHSKTIVKTCLKSIIDILRAENSEYRELMTVIGTRAHPHLNFVSYNHPTYFPSGIKQQWVKK